MQEIKSTHKFNTPTIISLYNQSTHHKAINTFSKNLTHSPSYFLELAVFKQQLKNNFPKVFTYRSYSKKASHYRMIFFGLALIFLILGGIIFYQNIAFTTLLFGDLRLLVRNSLCIITGILASSCMLAGYSICIAKEATESLAYKAQRKLAKLYAKKRMKCGIQHGFTWLGTCDKALVLKATFQEIKEKISEKKIEVTELLREISLTNRYDRSNHELLFSQALAEMDEHLKRYLQRFKDYEM